MRKSIKRKYLGGSSSPAAAPPIGVAGGAAPVEPKQGKVSVSWPELQGLRGQIEGVLSGLLEQLRESTDINARPGWERVKFQATFPDPDANPLAKIISIYGNLNDLIKLINELPKIVRHDDGGNTTMTRENYESESVAQFNTIKEKVEEIKRLL